MGYKLKKPLKGKGDQTIEIKPGNAEIIIVRVINNPNNKFFKFPPKLNIRLE